MLEFTCSSCGKRIQGDDGLAGKSVQCPVCALAMTAPGGVAVKAITTAEHPGPAKITVERAGAFTAGPPPVHPEPNITLPDAAPHFLKRCVPYAIVACMAAVGLGLIIPAVQMGAK